MAKYFEKIALFNFGDPSYEEAVAHDLEDLDNLKGLSKKDADDYRKKVLNYHSLRKELLKTEEGSAEEKEFLKKYKKDMDKKFIDLYTTKEKLYKKHSNE